MPEMVCVFWKFAMFAAVGACDLFAKYAVSALQYALQPGDRGACSRPGCRPG